MNHWLAEELTWQAYTERKRELDVIRLLKQCDTLHVNWSLTTRVALKFSGWLIATGEKIQLRYKKAAPGSAWVENRKFAR